MRHPTGCNPCRTRHLKCVNPPGSGSGSARCERCAATGRECVVGVRLRFRAVTSVREDRLKRLQFKFKESQVWFRTPILRFKAPVGGLEELEELEELEGGGEGGWRAEMVDQDAGVSTAVGGPVAWCDGPRSSSRRPGLVQAALLPGESLGDILEAHHENPSQDASSVTEPDEQLPAISPPTGFIALPALPDHLTTWPLKSRSEARFFHHYLQNLGPWVDVCDENLHFGREVPRRAANYPVLSHAMMAASARHLSRSLGTQDMASAEYVSACLRILIPLLDDPVGVLDENLVAAIVILRHYEEMDDYDAKHHLDGGKHLLNAIARFIPAGGLGEAASWVFLRQAIYVSLTTSRPLDINLSTYEASSSFVRDDAGAWANRMVLTFAKVLDFAFQQDQGPAAQGRRWQSLSEEVDAWDAAKPWHFQPLWVGSFGVEAEDPSPFPPIWMAGPANAIGKQYYALAKIVLATSDPRKVRLGFGALEARRASEATILANLRVVVGLSFGSGDIPAAMFHACHILCACGSYLESAADRHAAVDFLVSVEERIAWCTGRIIAALRQQWRA